MFKCRYVVHVDFEGYMYISIVRFRAVSVEKRLAETS